jgi:3-oxoacyl-[acyl-carrier protein] reductase
MSESIRDRIAIITGSTKGIGLGIAKALLAEGARVAISARNAREVDSVSKELARANMGRVLGKACDVRQEAEVRALFDAVDREWGGLDYLVNNAGIGLFKNVEEITLEEWNAVIETNLTGVFLCTRAAIPRMRKRGGGYIVNISSLAGRNAFPTASAYNTSKFGLNGFSEAVMQEIRYDGIKLSYIMPGSVNTEFGSGKVDGSQSWKVQPEDIAEIVVDLFRHPARSLPSRVEIRPSQPPKK